MSNRSKFISMRRGLLAGTSALAILLSPISLATPAQAAPVAGFNPGNIIDDALFYNGNAMSGTEIQTFLNQRLSNCLIGTPPYTPGAPSPSGSGNIIASNCLKSFKQTTSSRAADAYCSGYVGMSNESAAEIIAKVGRACGISQKVLLVMLEKEQSLLTDSWPVTRQYNYALGMNCPDSGPGNSANCDAASAGFALQLYLGARQLKVYKGDPDSFNYRPFQINTIQWHPTPGCGTSQVYIENWATAALYIYTPYRPNQAALNAGWGIGDSCSSYGNRNFFNFFNSWFGLAAETHAKIDAAYAQNPWLGAATSGYNRNPAHGGGTVRAYQNGVITWQEGATSAYVLSGPTRGFFTSGARGLNGPLGRPTGNETCQSNGDCVQDFRYGSIRTTGGSGTVEIPAITALLTTEGERLGKSLSPLNPQSDNGGGFVQAYENGAITWNNSVGAYSVSGSIRSTYGTFGGPAGTFGWPSGASTYFTASGGGYVQGFQNAAITSSTPGTFAISGPVRTTYAIHGGINGSLGWPSSNLNTIPAAGGGQVQAFQNGALVVQNGADTALVLDGDIRQVFNASGAFTSGPGWPTTNATFNEANGGGYVQGFQNAAITSSTAGTYMIGGPVRTTYGTYGGINGSLGWPSSPMTCSGTICHQEFQNGSLSVDTHTGVATLGN